MEVRESGIGSFGSSVQEYSYDVFGAPIGPNTPEFFGYTGKPYDPMTGLYDYGFRDYDAGSGRFRTVDPIRDGANWYAYVNNDPVNFIDPLGLLPAKPGTGEGPSDPKPNPVDQVVEFGPGEQVVLNPINTESIPAGILDQNDPSLAGIPNMAESGCYYRTCQAFAEITVGQALTAEQIQQSVTTNQNSGAVTKAMRVNNPDTVINDAFERLGRPDLSATFGWGSNGQEPAGTRLRGTTPNGNQHYLLGNSAGDVVYDPYNPDIQNMQLGNSVNIYLHGNN